MSVRRCSQHLLAVAARPRRSLHVTLLVCVALLLTACGGEPTPAAQTAEPTSPAASGTEGSEPTGTETAAEVEGALDEPTMLNITAGLQGLPYLQLLVAEDQGLYEKRNLAVQAIEVAGTTAIAAVEAGQADVTVTLPENIINARARGSTLRIVGATVSENLYRLYATPDVGALEDLAGRQVGMFNEGNGTDIQLRWLLDEHGVGHEQSTFVAIGGLQDRLAALQNGQVAATLLFPPYDVQAERAGLPELAVMRDYVSGYPNEVIAVTDQVLAERGDVIRAFLAAIAEASAFIDENPEEAIRIAVEATGAEQALIEDAFAFMKGTYAEGAAVEPEGLEWTLDIVSRYTEAGELPTVDELYDASYLPEQ